MDDFGHTSIRMRNFFVDAWGAGPFVIECEGKAFRFEDSDRFGPLRLNEDDEISFFAASSPFWKVWRKWRDQGRRIAEDGVTCLWD